MVTDTSCTRSFPCPTGRLTTARCWWCMRLCGRRQGRIGSFSSIVTPSSQTWMWRSPTFWRPMARRGLSGRTSLSPKTPGASTPAPFWCGGAIGHSRSWSASPRASSASPGTSRCSSGRCCARGFWTWSSAAIGRGLLRQTCSCRPRCRLCTRPTSTPSCLPPPEIGPHTSGSLGTLCATLRVALGRKNIAWASCGKRQHWGRRKEPEAYGDCLRHACAY
mmetsp:Transcript_116968/g.261555  ORF Transcript_116968/g.261555 Transcript_116968/m.261555 type:complete len:220 (+) Transcript_116968:650-1309(+)